MTDALLDDVTQATADFLLSREAQRACAGLTSNDLSADRTLATLLRLRGEFSGEEAGAILTLARLRLRAASKFPDAERMYFTPEALEQATAWPVALHRAEWIHRNAPSGSVLDLGCGIGGDTLALATYRRVIAFEKDPVRVQFASANARATGREDRIEFQKTFRTPIFDTESVKTIPELPSLNGTSNSFYCGSHFGHGLHEDAVSSAIAVARRLGVKW